MNYGVIGNCQVAALIDEQAQAGALLAAEGLHPSSKGARVRARGAERIVTDGPFTEAKEGIVGFALIEAKSKDEAVEYSRRFWGVVGDGEGKIYQVFGPGDRPPGA